MPLKFTYRSQDEIPPESLPFQIERDRAMDTPWEQ